MSQYVDGSVKTFTASGAITQWALVKYSSAGVVAVAGLAEEPLGVALKTVADGELVPIMLLSKQGTINCIAANAVTAGAVVYGRASGKVDDVSTSSAIQVGIALEAATATNDIIEVLPKCA